MGGVGAAANAPNGKILILHDGKTDLLTVA